MVALAVPVLRPVGQTTAGADVVRPL